tara:strand:- start:607 stop:906 length:300 start_codon:yes stop_codon:yes gene_type:complete
MEFLNSKKFIIIMLIVLVWAGLSSCSSPKVADNDSHVIEKDWNDLDKEQADKEAKDKERATEDNPRPADFVGIADMLGCVFAPDDCVLEKRKQEKKMDR